MALEDLEADIGLETDTGVAKAMPIPFTRFDKAIYQDPKPILRSLQVKF